MIILTVNGPDGPTETLEAIVDTGFNGFLCLPEAVVLRPHLPYLNSATVFMAEDRRKIPRIRQAQIDWNGKARTFGADASGAVALVGMQLMTDLRLEMDIRIGGAVRVHGS